AETERHSRVAVERFCSSILARGLEEVIVAEVPKKRRFMHPDTILGRVNEGLVLAYPPALRRTWLLTAGKRREILDFRAFLAERGIELIAVSDAEQRSLACTFVALSRGVILHYETALCSATRRRLARRGVEVIPFQPRALLAGGGSLRCMTLRLHRQREGASRARQTPPSGTV
ncbi:MAG: arginine deiminase family protein, partial [Pseudomonadota bacterium]